MTVIFEFASVATTRTELRLTQTGFPDRENAEHHGIGWGCSFDKLKVNLG